MISSTKTPNAPGRELDDSEGDALDNELGPSGHEAHQHHTGRTGDHGARGEPGGDGESRPAWRALAAAGCSAGDDLSGMG